MGACGNECTPRKQLGGWQRTYTPARVRFEGILIVVPSSPSFCGMWVYSIWGAIRPTLIHRPPGPDFSETFSESPEYVPSQSPSRKKNLVPLPPSIVHLLRTTFFYALAIPCRATPSANGVPLMGQACPGGRPTLRPMKGDRQKHFSQHHFSKPGVILALYYLKKDKQCNLRVVRNRVQPFLRCPDGPKKKYASRQPPEGIFWGAAGSRQMNPGLRRPRPTADHFPTLRGNQIK